MNAFSKDEIKALIGKRKGLCVSIFMPAFRTGAESQQNQIRLRNLLRSAEERLLSGGLRPQEVRQLLEPAQALPGNVLFWKRQSDGLALFLARDLFRCFRLPETFEESLVVADHFHIKPLLPLLAGDRRFYILALSQKEVRLLEGTRYHVQEIELESLPKGLSEALQYDDLEKQVRFRAGSPGGGSSMVSGHGADIDDAKENLLKYFRLIDRGLRDLLREEQVPLILAGVEYLFPIYREANTYPHLLEGGIAGNPQGIRAEALHRMALELVAPFFGRAEEDALAQYRQSSGTGLTSSDLGEIVPASLHGRIGLLFTAPGRGQWGSFSEESGAVELHPERREGSVDLVEAAAIQTFLNGGAVFVLPPGQMPDAHDLVAVFRY